MRRARVLIPLAFGLFFFVGLSILLARGLAGGGTERSEVLEVLRAQARGDAAGRPGAAPRLRAPARLRADDA